MKNDLLKFWQDESGASLAEYGLLVGLIAVVAIAMMTSLGEGIRDKFSAISGAISSAGGGGGG